MDRCRADHMGMLATAINALALQDSFQHAGLNTVVMTAVEMDAYADRYNAEQPTACCPREDRDLRMRHGLAVLPH